MDDKKVVTLKDLKSTTDTAKVTSSKKLKEVSAAEIRPNSSKKDPMEKRLDDILGNVNKAIERKEKEVDIRRDEIIETLASDEDEKVIFPEEHHDKSSLMRMAEGEDDEDNEEETKIKESHVMIDKAAGSSIFIKNEDLDDEDDEELEAESNKQLAEVKSVIKSKIKPVINIIDLASFSISKKPISVLNSLKTNLSTKRTISWVLPATGIPISMESFGGLEIQKLDPKSSSKNRFDTYREIYGILFDHVIDPNKPKTIEEWVKLLNFFDINHIYFTAYKASFEGVNSIPYNCPHCSNIFMKDTEIDDMVKYKNDAAKKLVADIFAKDTASVNKYDVELVQVSDDYVIGLREPSIYNIIFENVILDEKFTTTYSDLLSLISYVDCIYYINREENDLQPIDIKQYPDNAVKTIKGKIRKYSQILQTLTSDQFYSFNSLINVINEKHDEIVYILPEVECPKCKTVIPEQEMSAETLLFTRHQLAGIANTSTN